MFMPPTIKILKYRLDVWPLLFGTYFGVTSCTIHKPVSQPPVLSDTGTESKSAKIHTQPSTKLESEHQEALKPAEVDNGDNLSHGDIPKPEEIKSESSRRPHNVDLSDIPDFRPFIRLRQRIIEALERYKTLADMMDRCTPSTWMLIVNGLNETADSLSRTEDLSAKEVAELTRRFASSFQCGESFLPRSMLDQAISDLAFKFDSIRIPVLYFISTPPGAAVTIRPIYVQPSGHRLIFTNGSFFNVPRGKYAVEIAVPANGRAHHFELDLINDARPVVRCDLNHKEGGMDRVIKCSQGQS